MDYSRMLFPQTVAWAFIFLNCRGYRAFIWSSLFYERQVFISNSPCLISIFDHILIWSLFSDQLPFALLKFCYCIMLLIQIQHFLYPFQIKNPPAFQWTQTHSDWNRTTMRNLKIAWLYCWIYSIKAMEMYIMLSWHAHYTIGTRSLSNLVFFSRPVFGTGL